MAAETPLLEVENLRVEYHDRHGRRRTILSGVELELSAGETVGIVGESGSGKSIFAKAVARLLPRDVHADGVIRFRGEDVMALTPRRMESLRGPGMTILYQDPFTMLNPLLRAGSTYRRDSPGATAAAAGKGDCTPKPSRGSPKSGSRIRTSLTSTPSSCPVACASVSPWPRRWRAIRPFS